MTQIMFEVFYVPAMCDGNLAIPSHYCHAIVVFFVLPSVHEKERSVEQEPHNPFNGCGGHSLNFPEVPKSACDHFLSI